MPSLHWTDELRQRVDELVDEYRVALHDSLNDLSEEEARRRQVPSKTTLLGLVKHATFVEGVWFDQAITGRSYAEIGIATTVDGSFALRKGDTIDTVRAARARTPRRPRRHPARTDRRKPIAERPSPTGALRAGYLPRGHLRRVPPEGRRE